MRKFLSIFLALAMSALASSAFAQAAENTRTVGRKGAKQLSLSFATVTQISRGGSAYGYDVGSQTSTSIFGAVDMGRFLTERFVLSFGISGSGTVEAGSTPMFYSNAGGVVYFTPRKVSSAYIGGDISTLLIRIEGADIKPEVLGKFGVQTAIKENASIFIEAAYGGAINALSTNGSLRTRVGLRVLF